MASEQQQEEELKTFPLKIMVDKQSNKVVVVEATKDFIDTLFSFLSLPLGTIIPLVTTTANNNNNDDQQQQQPLSEDSSSPLLNNITNLYQSVQSLTPNDVWNPVCQQMLLHPRNPIEALCCNLFLNVDDSTEPTRRLFVCDSCYKFTTFPNMVCTCGKPINKQPWNLDEGQENSRIVEATKGGVFVHESMFMVFDDMKIVPSSLVTSMQKLLQLGYSDLTQLEQVTQNIGKHEILNLLKYTLTSHEPLTNTILASSSNNKGNPPNRFASAIRVMRPCTGDSSKMDVKLVQSKSQKKIIFAEANGDFVDFMFSFLTLPLGSIVKLLGGNSFAGCVDNLYKSVENLESSWCLDSCSVLLNPSVAPQFGCPNQPLNITDVVVESPSYYYGIGTPQRVFDRRYGYRTTVETVVGGVISKSEGSIYEARRLTELDPRSPNSSKVGVVGFVKRPALYCVGDDLKVKPLSSNYCLSYLKELSLPLDDLELQVISIGEAEALSLLRASLTSKFTLTTGLEDLLNVPKQELNLAIKYTQTIQLHDLSEEPKQEA